MKRDNYKWWLLLLLFGTFFLEQGARQIYSATLPQIKIDFASFGVSDAMLGMVSTVFTMTFGLALVGSGLAADFLGRKKVLIVGTVLFAFGVGGCGFAEGIVLMTLTYGVLNALGQCCIAPPSYSLISQHHDPTTRSTAMGIFQSAVYFGIILSSVSAGWISQFGPGKWRWAFWGIGGVALLWSLAMRFFLRDTPPDGSSEERPTVRAAFAAILKKPTAILIALAFGMFMYTNCGLRLWTVAYLHRSFEGVSLASAAFHAVFWYYLGALVAMIFTARIMDRIGVHHPRIRLEVSAIGFLLCIAPMIWVAQASSLVECCAALGTLGLATGVYEAAHYPAMFDCIEPRYRSATTGITGCAAFLMGAFAPAMMGWMNEHLSMSASMASLSVFYLVGGLILLPAIFRTFKNDYVGN